jgi:TPR repeat protein
MKRPIKTLSAFCVIALAAFGGASAGPLEDGRAAYQRGDDATAMRLLLPLAEQGDAGAQTDLGWMYANGRGAPQDDAQALAWRRKAADQGNATAQFSLGLMYRDGQGAPQDFAQAAMWIRKAADQGHAGAQLGLGRMSSEGRGVPQDDAQAYMWFSLASRAADSAIRMRATESRDELAGKMTPAQIAAAQRMARAWVSQ